MLGSTGISLNSSAASLLISCSSSQPPPWPPCPLLGGISSNSSKVDLEEEYSSNKGMVVEETIEADLKLALLEPDEAELTVDMTERGDMQEVRPDRLLSPLSLLLWL